MQEARARTKDKDKGRVGLTPKGIRKSLSLLLLIQTIPASMSLATRCALVMSCVKSALPTPKFV